MDANPADYYSFLLRLWRTDVDGTWQASLEDPVTGERMGFKTVKWLYAYLLAVTNALAEMDACSIERHKTESDFTNIAAAVSKIGISENSSENEEES